MLFDLWRCVLLTYDSKVFGEVPTSHTIVGGNIQRQSGRSQVYLSRKGTRTAATGGSDNRRCTQQYLGLFRGVLPGMI